jgi:hypothetical protein
VAIVPKVSISASHQDLASRSSVKITGSASSMKPDVVIDMLACGAK